MVGLMEKYGVELIDNEVDYCVEQYSFVGNGIYLSLDEIEEAARQRTQRKNKKK